jgi:hypothetical protein
MKIHEYWRVQKLNSALPKKPQPAKPQPKPQKIIKKLKTLKKSTNPNY